MSDNKYTIAKKFDEFMEAVYPKGLPERNTVHVKQAFMSGALAILNIMHEISEEYGTDAADRIDSFMDKVVDELKAYGEERGIDYGGKL